MCHKYNTVIGTPHQHFGMAIDDVFKPISRGDTVNGNATSSFSQLPANILEAFIPGYSVISGFLLEAFGFDVTILVSVCALLFGLATSIRYIWKHARDLFEEHCMSYIRIESDDEIYEQVMDWIAMHNLSKRSRMLIATTGREDAFDYLDEEIDEYDPDSLVNFGNLDAKVPPKFAPSFGSHYFLHRGYLLQFKRSMKQVLSSGWAGSMIRDDEDITLSCVGRSTQPIKNLITEAREAFYKKEKACTVVRRPAPKEHRNRSRFWSRVASRPSRPMHTVILNGDLKERVLADINEYLHPSTKFWYAHRGIPYRRGYLLHGPPGTGKSSLAWAIAGVFGLDIYCISLVDPTLTEEDLSMMFSSLPRRCVVLLEDIDSAGLSKRQEIDPASAEKKPVDAATSDASKLGVELTKALESVSKTNKEKDKQGITLSGLLNAIDGVASHEGRVLVMTTNCPDKLDDALIRPGRIDMKVPFTNATKSQIFELFARMYSPDIGHQDKKRIIPLKLAPAPKTKHDHATRGEPISSGDPNKPTLLNNPFEHLNLTPPDTPTPTPTPRSTASPTPTDIESIAAEFASSLPEDTFTPAEIQGYLLTRKKEPLRALEEVTAWRDATLAAKEKRAKVSGNL